MFKDRWNLAIFIPLCEKSHHARFHVLLLFFKVSCLSRQLRGNAQPTYQPCAWLCYLAFHT
jgi:hypothetical protein